MGLYLEGRSRRLQMVLNPVALGPAVIRTVLRLRPPGLCVGSDLYDEREFQMNISPLRKIMTARNQARQ